MKNDKKYFLDNPQNIKRILRCLYGSCALLFLLDFVIHRHTSHSWENLWGFYAMYGFISCVALVLLAKRMRRILMRPENYYDAEGRYDEEKSDCAENSRDKNGANNVDA
jgi:hypothetical protein